MEHLNGYDLSRKWFDYCFENPEKIKPIHTAIYFFAIEHCNRLGWKQKFGFPSTMVMEAIGVKSYNTYINGLNDLVNFGVIEMIEKSKNQYSANIIALSKFNKAINKALDKAFIKHDTKQSESTIQSIDSINKQETKNNETKNKEQLEDINIYPTFNDFWNLYDKKTDRVKCEKLFKKLDQKEKELIMDYIPNYKLSQPDKTYRKNPSTFLNNKSWENELIFNNNGTQQKSNYEITNEITNTEYWRSL